MKTPSYAQRCHLPWVKFLLLVTFFLAFGPTRQVESVLPTAVLRLSDGSSTYAAPAWFGSGLPDQNDASYLPLRVPSGSKDGCGEVQVEDVPAQGEFVLLVERGNCFFDTKALAAQEAGASGLIVMNSLQGIYQVNSNVHETCWLVLHLLGCLGFHSKPNHTTARKTFRSTWCRDRRGMMVALLVGRRYLLLWCQLPPLSLCHYCL